MLEFPQLQKLMDVIKTKYSENYNYFILYKTFKKARLFAFDITAMGMKGSDFINKS